MIIREERPFFLVANTIMDDPSVIPTDKFVYVSMCKLAEENGEIQGNFYQDIQRMTRLSKYTIIESVNLLCEKGYLEEMKGESCYRLSDKKIHSKPPRNYKEWAEQNPDKYKKRKGFVYFLQADNGLIKIGKAIDLNQRLDNFSVKLPYELTLIHSIKTDDYSSLERYFHDKFSGKRKRGEWFELTEDDIKEVKEHDGC